MVVFFYSCSESSSKDHNFKRISFEIGNKKGSNILDFNKKTFTWSKNGKHENNVYSRDIINGVGIEVKKKIILRVLPKSYGKKGITFSFFSYSVNKDLEVSVIFRRNKKIINQKIFKKHRFKKFSHTFNDELELKKNDEIFLEAEGKGVFIVSDLIVYDIIPKDKRKYIFIIALDNMRADKVNSIIRNNISLTPALNKLKLDSVSFSNAFSQSSWTYPAFMSMFSGLYEHNLNLKKNSFLSYDKPFLVEQMSKKFITVNFNGGVWLHSKHGSSRGFDLVQFSSGPEAKFSGKILFNKAIKYLKNNEVPQLMMFLHTYQVHAPFSPKYEFLKKINPSPKFTVLRNFTKRNHYRKGVDPIKKKSLIELYEAEIMEFDSYFNQFITYLKSAGIYDQSMIVFLSDHGEEFYEHSGWYHGHSLYNELVKVPLIIKFPGTLVAPQVISHNVGLLDLFPTLLDFYQISAPDKIDGVSLMQAIRSGIKPRKEIYFSTSCSLLDNVPIKIGMIREQYKIIYNFPYTTQDLNYFSKHPPPDYKPFEIYDLKTDPMEYNDLVNIKQTLLKKNKIKLKKIIKKIKKNSSQKVYKPIKLNKKEKEQLKSLGYL